MNWKGIMAIVGVIATIIMILIVIISIIVMSTDNEQQTITLKSATNKDDCLKICGDIGNSTSCMASYEFNYKGWFDKTPCKCTLWFCG